MHIQFFEKNKKYAPFVLRLALAAVFLWFGFSQLQNPAMWAEIVPSWAVSFSGMSAETLVYINGIFEIIGGSMLALGIFVSPVAFLLFLHLLVITSNFGVSPVGVRDFGLSFATLAIAFFGSDSYCFMREREKENTIL